MKVALDMDDPAPALREVEALERQRNALAAEVSRLEQQYTAASLLDKITEAHVATLLDGIAENIDAMARENLKDFLSTLIDTVTLDPVSHDCRVNYRIGLDLRHKVAGTQLRNCPEIRVYGCPGPFAHAELERHRFQQGRQNRRRRACRRGMIAGRRAPRRGLCRSWD